ncbi:hypothetical protein R4I72_05915 [Leclercia adecarboxylata]|uniref:hypothetical protein n=1 Tax=Leclercia adecarboxylata TaxID=83655 RepID=UPI0027CDE33A|nr:hypothetical protein [Leclercia adecarboxylata]MDQ2127984.1 hypothetical protein [Leclercia adecarboxylata]MDV7056597.1 hypothetical protein [Leclercia adecarboxylata]
MTLKIDFKIPTSTPIASPEKVWELQCKLDALAQELYGLRNPLFTLNPPVFTNDPDAPQVGFSNKGAHAELNDDAANDWVYCIYQLSHETIHLLDPRRRPPAGTGSNYLEEGVAVEFSLLVCKSLLINISVKSEDYKEARNRLLKIGIKDFHGKLKLMRESAGHFADVSGDLITQIAPACRGHNATKLAESFYS